MHGSDLPASTDHQNHVKVFALPGGFITLPEKTFVTPSQDDALRTVPSLSFLIQHIGANDETTNIMFDLGLRSSISNYTASQQHHLNNRKPFALGPSIASQLAEGGLDAAHDIDIIILSHVHYDHHGDPDDFPTACFIIGPGSGDVLRHGLPGNASHQHFQADLLPLDRTKELTKPGESDRLFELQLHGTSYISKWRPWGPLTSALDILGDQSLYIVDSPGHLPGHINLLCRVGDRSWIYLAGDSCHDRRILTGEKQVSTWQDAGGRTCCIHVDKLLAEQTLLKITALQSLPDKVEIILAHDWQWYESNKDRCFSQR